MPERNDYPFQLKDAVLISFNIRRKAAIPEVVRVNVAAGVREEMNNTLALNLV